MVLLILYQRYWNASYNNGRPYPEAYFTEINNKIILFWDENYIFGVFSERISLLILSEKTPNNFHLKFDN